MDRSMYNSMKEVEEIHWWFQGRRQVVNAILDRAMPRGSNFSILDVGCGTGGQMKDLAKHGNVVGIDIDLSSVQYCTDQGLDARQGNIEKLPFNDNSFDCITAFDVLEHVDDQLAIAEARRVLRPGGFLIFTVPAFQFMWSRHDDLCHHRRRYTRAGLMNELRGGGFAMGKVSYYNTLLFPLIFTVRKIPFLDNLMTSEKSLKVPNPLINSILTSVFASERHILANIKLPFGNSLIGIVR